MAMTALDFLVRPELVQQAWDYFRNVQTKDQKYTAAASAPADQPIVSTNAKTMEQYRPEMRKYYFDPDEVQDLPGAAGDQISDGQSRAFGSRRSRTPMTGSWHQLRRRR